MKPVHVAMITIVGCSASVSLALSLTDAYPDRFHKQPSPDKVGLASGFYIGRCSITKDRRTREGIKDFDQPGDCDLPAAYRDATSSDIRLRSYPIDLPSSEYYSQQAKLWDHMKLHEYGCENLPDMSRCDVKLIASVLVGSPLYDYIRGLQTSAIIRRMSKPYLHREYAKQLPLGITRQPEKKGTP